MAEEKLTPDEHAQLETEFEQARRKAGLGTFEDYHKLVVDMSSLLTTWKETVEDHGRDVESRLGGEIGGGSGSGGLRKGHGLQAVRH